MWCIPPEQDAAFVAAMEQVLSVYQRPYDPLRPVVNMDEQPIQLVSHSRSPLPMRPGDCTKIDYEYVREGMCNAFMFVEPLAGWREVHVSKTKTALDWAHFIKWLVDLPRFADASRITLVCDNLNTHTIASLYKAFDAPTAGRLRRRLRLVQTPVNGSWLNVAEMELSVLSRQCLGNRRFNTKAEMEVALAAWATARNATKAGTRWQFTTADARVKLKALYPIPDIER